MNKSAQRYIDLAFEYHVAAMTLNTQIFDAPYLYNPTGYLLRHTIELLLKGLIIDEENNDMVFFGVYFSLTDAHGRWL